MKITVSFMKKNASLMMLAMLLSLMFVEPSFATAWTGTVNTLLGNISTGLKTIGAAVITVALMFAGYQIAFGGKTVASVAPIVIGAIVIGAATALGTLLIPK